MMGKVLKVVAAVAVAAAVAWAAPYLAPAFTAMGASVTVATAMAVATLTIISNYAMVALTAAPIFPSGPRVPAFEYCSRTFSRRELPLPDPEPEDLLPIEPGTLRGRQFLPGQRYCITRCGSAEDCMAPILRPGQWVVIDRLAPIRAGDLISFWLDDMWTSYMPGKPWWYRLRAATMIKRYLGTDDSRNALIFDCLNPPTLCETGFAHVTEAFRVRAIAPSFLAALWAMLAMMRDPNTLNTVLGLDRG